MTADPSRALAHRNRMGDTYYLHQGKTKTGKPRYFFAKTVREGALAEMPEGYECSESINGVVSVRRKETGRVSIPEADLRVVAAELGRHPHPNYYLARVEKDAIVIYEPHPRGSNLLAAATPWGRTRKAFVEERMARTRYEPVMKFVLTKDGYFAFRMTYRGDGGWSWPLASGKLSKIVKKLVKHIGTDEFYELM